MNRPGRRTKHQMGLIKVLSNELPTDFYPLSVGSSSPIWDVILIKMIPGIWQKCIGIEVKSTSKGVFYLSKQKEQSDFYNNQLDAFGMVTCYAMRMVKKTGKKIVEEECWRFFWLHEIDKKIVWEDGMELNEFIIQIMRM